jgi:hypothetical protein
MAWKRRRAPRSAEPASRTGKGESKEPLSLPLSRSRLWGGLGVVVVMAVAAILTVARCSG